MKKEFRNLSQVDFVKTATLYLRPQVYKIRDGFFQREEGGDST